MKKESAREKKAPRHNRVSGTARKQRDIQRGIAAREDESKGEKRSSKSSGKKKNAVQAGPRPQPLGQAVQHLNKPGDEHRLDPAPRYSAPFYRGSGKLQDGFGVASPGTYK